MPEIKGALGLQAAFLDACRDELRLCPADLHDAVAVIRDADRYMGLVQVSVTGHLAELDRLFVDPDALGQGLGRALFGWAVSAARDAGATAMGIASDPGARPFYLALGAHEIGTVASGSVPGRRLPLLRFGL